MKKNTKQSKHKKVAKQESTEESMPAGTKYSVVLRFWSVPQEIQVVSIVPCEDRITKCLTYKFLDSDGRIWHDVPFSDVIIIQNYPNKEDVENYSNLIKQSENASEQLKNTPQNIRDVNIG